MNKLRIIEETLRKREDIVLLPKRMIGLAIYDDKAYGHSFTFFVAPKNGLYKAEELQEFMTSLFPDLHAPAVNPFYEARGEMRLGLMYFEEIVGKVKNTQLIICDDDDFAESLKTAKQKTVVNEEKDLIRGITVRVFPNEELARKYRNEYVIPEHKLRKYRKEGFFQSIRNRLGCQF